MEPSNADIDPHASADFLPVGTRLLGGQYVIERYLGSGGFGITYVARDSLDRQVVIKECFPEALCQRKNKTVVERSRTSKGQFHSIVEMFVREARSLAKLQHHNIVGVHQVFKDNETAYMALDLVQGQDLLDIIETRDTAPPYKEVKSVLWRLLDAIALVHEGDMLHRDISPDNILIAVDGRPVLIDFGAAREEASKKSRALSAVQVVKDGYSPQEFYVAGSQQGPYSDLYALAATFSHVISGEAPPNSQIRLAAVAAGKPDPYVPLLGQIEGYPDDFLAAIDQAMALFPQDRIQDAREWLKRIDERKGPTVPYPTKAREKEIEKTVTRLLETEEKNAPLANDEAPKVAKPVAPAPEPVKPQVSFKQRFAELEYPFEPDPDHPVIVEDEGPDWIEKARLKQQERVAASEAALSALKKMSSKPRDASDTKPDLSPSKLPVVMMVLVAMACAVLLGLNGDRLAGLVSSEPTRIQLDQL